MAARHAAVTVLAATLSVLGVATPSAEDPRAAAELDEAQRLFYTARFDDAVTAARALVDANPDELPAWELLTSAQHLQLRRLIGDTKDKRAAFSRCAECPRLLSTLLGDINRGRAVARARLERDPKDDEAGFYLSKMDLTYLWLQLATLDRRTGWHEYSEARHLLEDILDRNPTHVRARVARAWMDYIVGTRVPWGTRWLMGGGNRSRALKTAREAAQTPAAPYAEAEARFALLEMLTREGKREEAVEVAKELLMRFPGNQDLVKFVDNGGQPPASR